jgi:hypothetical protein
MHNRRETKRARRSPRSNRLTGLTKQYEDYASGAATSQQQADVKLQPIPNTSDSESLENSENDNRDQEDNQFGRGITLAFGLPLIVASFLLLLYSSSQALETELAINMIWTLSFGSGFYFFVRSIFVSGRDFSIKWRVISAIVFAIIYVPGMIVVTLTYTILFSCLVVGNCLMIDC